MKKTIYVIIAVVIIAIIGIFIFRRTNLNAPSATPVSQTDLTTQPTSTTTATTKAPIETTIKIGESGVINGITIKIVGLLSDSRCPVDVNCIQAGSISLNTVVSKGKVIADHNFISGNGAFSFEGSDLSIVKVLPIPTATQKTPKLTDYHITFQAIPTPVKK